MFEQDGGSVAMGRLKRRALSSTALSLLLVGAAHSALAQAPAAGTLPGKFSTNVGGVTYTATDATHVTITTGGGNNVLQWGGAALGTAVPAPGAIATPTGNFSIAGGAQLTIAGAAATGVLVNDQTGSPSQVFGALKAGGLGGPLFIANQSGVIVGAGGTITAPSKGVGLVGFAQDSKAFAGTVVVTGTTAGSGDVTVSGTVSGGNLLVAGNGTVNVGTTRTTAAEATYLVAGFPFNTPANGVNPVGVGAAPIGGSKASVNIQTGANVDLTLGGGGSLFVAGALTNSGQLTEAGLLTATAKSQLAGSLVNTGRIDETGGSLTIATGVPGKVGGSVQSTGDLNFAGAAGALSIVGANIDLEGQVLQGGKALSKTNALTGILMLTSIPGSTTDGRVIDIGASLFTSGGANITANAVRMVTGGSITDNSGAGVTVNVGTGAASITDPFTKSKLNYTFSTFPGTTIASSSSVKVANLAGNTNFDDSPGMNLNGILTAPTVTVMANNINGTGGLQTTDGGTINITAFGNVNEPSGAASHGSTAFNWNFLPVTVGPTTGGKTGAATVNIVKGPSVSGSSIGTEQNFNLLVSGNVTLTSLTSGTNVPPGVVMPAPILTKYANNHLVVQATGNITVGPAGAQFNWPGLVYLKSGTSTADPTMAPAAGSTITIGGTGATAGANGLRNIVPADFTTASIGGQIGNGGVFFITPGLSINAAQIDINNNSFANFVDKTTAAAFALTSSKQFNDAKVTGGTVSLTPLPTTNFQPQ